MIAAYILLLVSVTQIFQGAVGFPFNETEVGPFPDDDFPPSTSAWPDDDFPPSTSAWPDDDFPLSTPAWPDDDFPSSTSAKPDDDVPGWMNDCKKLNAIVQEILFFVGNLTKSMYNTPRNLVEDFNAIRKCSGLFKPICIANGLIKIQHDLQHVKSDFLGHAQELNKKLHTIKRELITCFLHQNQSTSEFNPSEQFLMQLKQLEEQPLI